MQPLFRGEKAPFDGQLLTHRRAARLSVRANTCAEEIGIRVSREKEIWKIKLNLERRLRENEKQSLQQKLDLLQKELEEKKVPWYRQPAFVVPATVIASALVTWGSIEAWAKLSKKIAP